MSTLEHYARQPREQRMQHLTRTGDALAAAIKGQSDAVLARRPDAKNWAAKEVVCHLRDVEALFMTRFEVILAADEPPLTGLDPDRWAQERQYSKNDTAEAVSAFRTAGPDAERLSKSSNARATAPARAPASAEFWAWLRAVMNMPTSMASVVAARNAMKPMPTNTNDIPRSSR